MFRLTTRCLQLLSAGLLVFALSTVPSESTHYYNNSMQGHTNDKPITFVVPVKVSKIIETDINRGHVECIVYPENPQDPDLTSGAWGIGIGRRQFNIVDGQFEGTVHVNVLPHSFKPVSFVYAHHAVCVLRVYDGLPEAMPQQVSQPSNPPRHWEARPDEFFQSTIGPLPIPSQDSQ